MWALAILLIQDNELQRGLDTTMKQSSYEFSIERPAVGKKKKAAGSEITGIFAGGVLYIKYGKTEIARSNDYTYVNLDGSGWKNYGEVKPEKSEDEDQLTLAELVKIPSPHILLKSLVSQIRKAAPEKQGDETDFQGDISDTTARELTKEPWFGQGIDKELTQVDGGVLVTVNKDHLITLFQIDIAGKVVGDTSKAPPVRHPRQHPRAAAGRAGSNTNPGEISVRIKLSNFGNAKLPIPDDIQKKLGVKVK